MDVKGISHGSTAAVPAQFCSKGSGLRPLGMA